MTDTLIESVACAIKTTLNKEFSKTNVTSRQAENAANAAIAAIAAMGGTVAGVVANAPGGLDTATSTTSTLSGFSKWYSENGFYQDTVSPRRELMELAWNAGQQREISVIDEPAEILKAVSAYKEKWKLRGVVIDENDVNSFIGGWTARAEAFPPKRETQSEISVNDAAKFREIVTTRMKADLLAYHKNYRPTVCVAAASSVKALLPYLRGSQDEITSAQMDAEDNDPVSNAHANGYAEGYRAGVNGMRANLEQNKQQHRILVKDTEWLADHFYEKAKQYKPITSHFICTEFAKIVQHILKYSQYEAAPEREAEYHIERNEEGIETLILHAVDKTDTDEAWVRHDVYQSAKERELIKEAFRIGWFASVQEHLGLLGAESKDWEKSYERNKGAIK